MDLFLCRIHGGMELCNRFRGIGPLIAFFLIVWSYWHIDIAVFAPRLLLWHWGYGMLAAYCLGTAAAFYLTIKGIVQGRE